MEGNAVGGHWRVEGQGCESFQSYFTFMEIWVFFLSLLTHISHIVFIFRKRHIS